MEYRSTPKAIETENWAGVGVGVAMKRINGGLLNHANEQNQSPVDHAAKPTEPIRPHLCLLFPIIALFGYPALH